MSRRKKHELRSELFAVYSMIPKIARDRATERERDLIGEANCAIWEGKLYKISACLRRLVLLPERGEKYVKVMELLAL